MRVKFTTPPGEQFVMRREVYWRIQKAFRAAGIEFAHRDVTVYMPTDGNEQAEKKSTTSKDDNKKRLQTGAAAGVASMG